MSRKRNYKRRTKSYKQVLKRILDNLLIQEVFLIIQVIKPELFLYIQTLSVPPKVPQNRVL